MRIPFSLLCLVVAGYLAGQEQNQDWLIEKITFDYAIKPGDRVELHNDFGDVRARATEDQTVAVSAMVQRHKDDTQKLKIVSQPEAGKLVLRLAYDGDLTDTFKAGGKRRGDVTIFVPKNSPFLARTQKGNIESRGVSGNVDLRSDRGKINFRGEGQVTLKSDQGDLHAMMLKADWIEPVTMETTVGEIMIQLPSDGAFTVESETGGEITTDFSIEITHNRAAGLKHGLIRVGDGAHGVFLKNKRGNIKILEGKWDPKLIAEGD